MNTSTPTAQKRTIVRPASVDAPAVLRAAFRTLEVVAPGLGARWAERLWFTVPRSGRKGDRPGPYGGREFVVDAGGGRMSVPVVGRSWGDGPAVYLVHGWGGWGGQLGAFVDPLVRAGYRVITFDAPSHGRSGPGRLGPRRTSGLEFSAALRAAVDEHGPAHAIVAHSLGVIGVGDVLRSGLGADRVIFLAPISNPANYVPVFSAILGLGPRIRARLPGMLERQLGRPLSTWDLPTLGSEITVPPLLLFHDSADRETSPADSEAIAASWPGAELVTTTGLGHRRIVRDPEVVAHAVEFISAGAAAAEH